MSKESKGFLVFIAILLAPLGLAPVVLLFQHLPANLPEPFTIGSLWFWLLLVAETVLLIGLVAFKQGVFATLSLLVSATLLAVWGDLNIYGYVIVHPWTVLLGIVGYFVAGTTWSVVKWWLFVRDQRARYDDTRDTFCREYRLADARIPEKLASQWRERLKTESSRGRKIEVPPLVRKHKADILYWMCYWPFSLVWTILNDPVRKTFLYIYRQIQDHMQAISDRVFAGVEKDFPEEGTMKPALQEHH